MAAAGGGGSSGEEDAKHVLDEFGQQVYKEKVEKDGADAEKYKEALKGNLQKAPNINPELVSTDKTCALVKEYISKVGATNSDPCGNEKNAKNEKVKRFSDTLGGQCTYNRIKDSKKHDNKGACAPYRRLHLCDYNLESISNYDSNAKHNLLAEVCMAAYYEGDLIKTHYTEHEQTNPDTKSQLCTVLARSFADIGDIVRGKDLYLGNDDEERKKRKQLENNLKTIFGKIHSEVTSGSNGKLKTRYGSDKGNFYQLREDWWNANRAKVWEAITCKAEGNTYFRRTCGGSNENTATETPSQCRCDGANVDPPTYFDYVPQYLRWFEEWAEDFCRKRKHKLEDAKSKCRPVKNGKKLYCDLNRHDCVETIRGDDRFVEEDVCKDCHFSCAGFVKWIDNQKLEFLKQKNKYADEMQKYTKEITRGGIRSVGRTKRAATTSNYEGYESKFYKKLKEGNYRKVDGFLELLNNETTCKKNNDIKEGGKIDFRQVNSGSAKKGDDSNKTFYRTKYCEACPWCGVKEEKGKDGKWEAKSDGECGQGRGYEDYENTPIPILTGDKGQLDMVQKYKKFCNGNGKNGATGATGAPGKNGASGKNGDNITETWTCYYYKKNGKDGGKGDSDDINFCVLQDGNENTNYRKDKSYNAFFWDWVHDMLIHSIKWRNELGSCINKNKENTCKTPEKCNRECGCFAKWVDQKKEKEWTKIKEHFDKQKGIPKGYYFTTLEFLLEKEKLLKSLREAYGDTEDIKRIEALLEKENEINQAEAVAGGVASGVAAGGTGVAGSDNSKIDKFLQEELDDATKCKDCQPTKVKNPCSGDKSGSSNTYPVLAEKVAADIHKKAQAQLGQNKSSLEGDIKKAQFKNGRSGSELNGDICNIDKNYSNDYRSKDGGPCYGKDNGGERFKIGKDWENVKENVKTSYEAVYLPPRREHMCTSNLEKLHVGDVTNNGNVNDTFLGNVLLAAKCEANNIIETYKKKNSLDDQKELTNLNDQATVCRAIRYSFADLGDIIRGRDLWDHRDNKKKLQSNLKDVFKKIKDKLPGIQGNEKYNGDDENNKPPYKLLREDWWEANRDQVWNAMKCALKSHNIPCRMTPDDYIPQRLRWMTEWAEWYCKMQKKEYEELEGKCKKCKFQGCTSGDVDSVEKCEKCKAACAKYEGEIQPWKQQWQEMEIKYTLSYLEAQYNSDGTVIADVSHQQLVAFLQKLQKEIKNSASQRSKRSTRATTTATTPITPYSTAAGYIHQELPNVGCNTQTEFCDKKNGDNSNSGKTNEKYAFMQPPPQYKGACECKPPSTPEGGDVRSDKPPADTAVPHAEKDEEDDDDDDDISDVEDDDEESKEANGDTTEHTTEEEKEPKEEVEKAKEAPAGPDVCQIVGDALKDDKSLQDACEQKYAKNNSRLGWKCVTPSGKPSEPTGKSDGSVCVPPRRRKLYVGKLEEWADKQSSQSQALSVQATENGVSTVSPGNGDDPQKALLKAFVESAAVETFFLWHRYKKENKTQNTSQLLGTGDSGDDEASTPDPQTQLASGDIPPSFLRQMFYTLGDYRDICVGKTPDGIDTVSASGNTKGESDMQKIKKAIDTAFNSGSEKNPSPSPSDDPRKTLWQTFAPSIWNGMICALTYEEKTSGSGQKPQITQDNDLKEALFGKDDKPKQNGTSNEPISQYQYKNVKLKEDESGPKQNQTPSPSGEKTTLVDFISRPPYFRYLEEWGESFCRERTKRLEKIKDDCKVENGEKQYSGDGESCKDQLPDDPTNFKDLENASCANSCSSYRKWIKGKKTQYEKQEKIYSKQKTDAKNNNGFYTKLEKNWTTATAFLQNLGPCKKDNDDNEIGEGKTIFQNTEETFRPAKNCKPCSQFKINCKNGKCSKDKEEECEKKKKNSISADDIKDENDSTADIGMLVSDDNTNGLQDIFEECVLGNCADVDIFKGFRKEEWKCRNVCGYVVCKPENVNGQNDATYIIQIRALVRRWVEYFLEDYKKIKHKISHCMKNGNGSKCTNDCPNKCKCVGQWVEKKREEWEEIKKRFNEQYKDKDSYPVKSFLETLIPQIGAANNEDKFIKLSKFDNSCGCNAKASSTNGNEEDAIDCMLNKLENLGKKISECTSQPSANNCTTSPTPPTTLEDDEEPEDLLLEEEQNPKNMRPGFCPQNDTTEQQEEEENICTPAGTVQKEAEEKETEQPTQPPRGEENPEEEAPAPVPESPAPAPAAPSSTPATPNHQPLPSDNTSDILKTTIPFGIALALTSIALLFLKKKTQSPVDLLRVLNIPKGEYGMPTLKSKNRYIPYRSGSYKGKTYIYMEGDTSGDEDKYMFLSDTTDVTSSESEYEEMDINDIYVPGSPKYKTLIEVVLEPSGKNTTASGKNTPSDTQNDIQNDGIPSSKITDNEWNTLKDEFISQYLQSEQPKDVPNDYRSGDIPFNTQPNTLYFDKPEEKPFITSIHDRDLYSGEEYNYDMSTNSGNNDLYNGKNNLYSGQNNVYSGIDPTSDNRGPYSDKNDRISDNHHPYSGIDLINDTLSGNQHIDIYDEVLKRKENELFGTNHVKHTSIHSVAKLTNSDPIHNQLELFHKWLDRHRDMCEKWENHHERLAKLKEEWENDTSTSGNTHTSDSNKTLNTD
ncbi:hypothetical protein C923_02027 [Plasmodium falciparum UGT5.1]|uniref:Duffy-binding-like domain-containing protein n=1 Tax=Plasmodium falciparum UGT5.1 TaxID=1237627 RepID=W7JQV3_PLAFA|nr:hypothetical protein C923_02027 [Plasmodium falciparum UGT5.1]